MKKVNKHSIIVLSFIIILHLYSYFTLQSSTLLTNKNSIIQLLIWIITLLTYTKYKKLYILFIPVYILILNELLFWYCDIDLYSSKNI